MDNSKIIEQLAKFDLADIIAKLQELEKIKKDLAPSFAPREEKNEQEKEDNTVEWSYHQNGNKHIKKTTLKLGKLHSYNDKPAYTEWDENGNLLEKKWYHDGLLNRFMAPAKIEYKDNKKHIEERYKNGSIIGCSIYNSDGMLYKDITYTYDGCKVSIYDSDETLDTVYYTNDPNYNYETDVPYALHSNNDEPALVRFYPDGNKKEEEWYQNNLLHREGDKPARIYYNDQGYKRVESWYKKGEAYRINDLPSYVCYYEHSNDIAEERWIEGNGEFHYSELKKPCIISYYHSGEVKEKTYKRSVDHKSVVSFDESGKKTGKRIWNGDKLIKTITYSC